MGISLGVIFHLEDRFDEIKDSVLKSAFTDLIMGLPLHERAYIQSNKRKVRGELTNVFNILLRVSKAPLPGIVSTIKIQTFLDDIEKMEERALISKYSTIFSKKGSVARTIKLFRSFEPEDFLIASTSKLVSLLEKHEKKFVTEFQKGLGLMGVKTDIEDVFKKIQGTPYLKFDRWTRGFSGYDAVLIDITLKEEAERFQRFLDNKKVRWPDSYPAPFFSTYSYFRDVQRVDVSEIQANVQVNTKVKQYASMLLSPITLGHYNLALFLPFLILHFKKRGAKRINFKKPRLDLKAGKEYKKMYELFGIKNEALHLK